MFTEKRVDSSISEKDKVLLVLKARFGDFTGFGSLLPGLINITILELLNEDNPCNLLDGYENAKYLVLVNNYLDKE